MKSEEPTYIKEYLKKYGTFDQVMSRLSFEKINILAADVNRLLSVDDVPSFIRLDQAFGEGSSVMWLFSHLKQLLLLLSVDQQQIADIQIQQIAATLVANYPTIKLSEFIWFESRLLGGYYERFFGKTSYFLVITRSFNIFVEELNEKLEAIRREQARRIQEDVSPGMSPEEFKQKMDSGEWRTLRSLLSSSRVPFSAPKKGELSEVEIASGLEAADKLERNVLGLDNDSLGAACYSFKRRYGLRPDAFILKYRKK